MASENVRANRGNCTRRLRLAGRSTARRPARARQCGRRRAARIDYLTFAHGAVPVRIDGPGASLGADVEAAVRVTDGDPTAFTVADGASADTVTGFVYELPAPTIFDRFAVPNVVETPSPTATFFRDVEVHGSTESPTAGFTLLASATLTTHGRHHRTASRREASGALDPASTGGRH